jgi:hypothetical protein
MMILLAWSGTNGLAATSVVRIAMNGKGTTSVVRIATNGKGTTSVVPYSTAMSAALAAEVALPQTSLNRGRSF